MGKILWGPLIFLLGFPGFSIGLTGSWEAGVDVLPSPGLNHVYFTVGVTNREFTLYTASVFEGDRGFTEERFGFRGHLGPLSLKGEALISPADVVLKSLPYQSPSEVWTIRGPIYRSSYLELGLATFGVDLAFRVDHFWEHVLELSYDEFGQSWSTACYSNARYLLVSRDREIDVPRVVITYYADPAKTIRLRREAVEGPFEVRPDLSDYTPGARAYLEQVAADRAAELGAAAYDIPSPSTDDLVFKLWVPHYMRYTFTTYAPPFRAVATFDDVGTGIQFDEATVTLEDVSPCCGIGFAAELSFGKCRGFKSLEITLRDALKLCCGLDFDITLRFTTTHKTVSLDFKGLALKPFVKIYAQPVFLDNYTIAGLDIYGFEIRCNLGDCSYIRALTAFDVFALEEILGEDIFRDDESEYVEVGVCGRACCGGHYRFKGFIYFREGSGSFMGIARVGADLSFPIFPGFSFGLRWDTSPYFSLTWGLNF